MIETVIVIGVISTVATIGTPQLLSSIRNYRLNSAVAAASGAIQSTRYLAIMHGYPYQLTFTANSGTIPTYQVTSEPSGTTSFSNVGGSMPIAGNPEETISQTTVLQFNSNGTMSVVSGGSSFSIGNGLTTKQITVSGVGNVSVTP